METHVQRLLQDKLYDKRKAGALELESAIRNCLLDGNHERIAKIVHQLCQDYAYSVHHPHARNGGLIGLAAAAIALGSEVAQYLREIVPPVLACFSDQDARVRYYACESMYNIAKVAKGEILVYFNDVFDALSKLSADTELSVKNGSELLDRLVKDVVAESAASYTSTVVPEKAEGDDASLDTNTYTTPAFNLPKFIPLLQERMNVLNPFARMFLVSWITILDQVPDLELVAYLPKFLNGLLRFLGDSNEDVYTATNDVLNRFLVEIEDIAAVKKKVAENKRIRERASKRSSHESYAAQDDEHADAAMHLGSRESRENGSMTHAPDDGPQDAAESTADEHSMINSDGDANSDGDPWNDEWLPGQDTQVDYPEILTILIQHLSEGSGAQVQMMAFKWIESFLAICPEQFLAFTPKLLQQLLPALSHDRHHVSQPAQRVNQLMMNYIMSLAEDPMRSTSGSIAEGAHNSLMPPTTIRQSSNSRAAGARDSSSLPRPSVNRGGRDGGLNSSTNSQTLTPPNATADTSPHEIAYADLDYEAAVGALTLQFLHKHEATRVAALAWLIMLHQKSPRKILAIQDATFPALLKTLSDPAEAVVTRDLLLLSQICKSSDDTYFSSFMINLLKLFSTDRQLLQTRGNLIIRQLCLTLSAERIYKTMADWLEREEDDNDFVALLVQCLNNNLLVAPEVSELRQRLRNLESKDGQVLFTTLFRAWCINSVATFSLCLLAQAYEHAYNVLLIVADGEMTATMLMQIDKLVQLLESPVFNYLRIQLLEPDRHPYLYKSLYGLLMLLPQSAAFAALKNRLNSVSPIGNLSSVRSAAATTINAAGAFERQNRLKNREESIAGIKWLDLLEKFRSTQERVRRARQRQLRRQHGIDDQDGEYDEERITRGIIDAQDPGLANMKQALPTITAPPTASANPGHTKGKSSFGNLGRFARDVRAGKTKK